MWTVRHDVASYPSTQLMFLCCGAGLSPAFFVPLLISILSLSLCFFLLPAYAKYEGEKEGQKFGLPVGGEHKCTAVNKVLLEHCRGG